VVEILDGVVTDVELAGSLFVLGLFANPIIDLVIGVTVDQLLSPVTVRLKGTGWIFRGDSGHNGGMSLSSRLGRGIGVLTCMSSSMTAASGELSALRDLLRQSPAARERYEAAATGRGSKR
jgi:GrpB-like predicted nucleotidyltransferase (UPF0157 family)